ncbi:phage tail protein, partial [Escherichia coli]
LEIHVRQRTMKKELEKLTSADEILAYRVDWK